MDGIKEYVANQLNIFLGNNYTSIKNKINDLSTQHNLNEICRIIDFMDSSKKFTIKMEKLEDDIDYYMRHKVSISSISQPPVTRSFILLDHNEVAPKKYQIDESLFDIPE